MGRAPCCDKEAKVKKGPWTPDEDLKLVAYIQEHGHGSWRALPEKAGLARCGKSCRLRWTNYLRPDIKRGRFTHEEEQTIFQFHAILGNRWSAIASRLPRRTDNEIKNYWNTHLKKRLNQVGIGPFSQTPASNLQDLLTSPWMPLMPTGLTHRTQWDLTVAEAQARLMPKLALKPQVEAAAVHPSAFFMGSWKSKMENTLKPLQGFSVLDSVRPDTVMGDACHGSMPTTEDSGEGRSGVVSGSGSVLGDSPVNKRAWWPDTVLGAACIGAVEHSGEGRSGIYSGSVVGDKISPTSVLHGHDSYTDVHSPCGSINSGTTSDCFDIILHQSSSLEQFPVIRDQLEPSSSVSGTFWERQHVALMEALKPDSLVVLGGADSETELESIIPLDFDEAEFPQFESLSQGTGQY